MGFLGFQTIDGSTTVNLLPIVLDKTTYKAMIAGTTTDHYTYNPLGQRTVTAGPDGITESKLYPVAAGIPGNWGTIKIGVTTTARRPWAPRSATGSPPRSSRRSRRHDPARPVAQPAVDHVQRQPRHQRGDQGRPDEHHRQAGLHPDLRPDRAATATTPGTGSSPSRRSAILEVNFQGNPKYVIVQPAKIPDSPTQVWGGVKSWPPDQEFRLSLTR